MGKNLVHISSHINLSFTWITHLWHTLDRPPA